MFSILLFSAIAMPQQALYDALSQAQSEISRTLSECCGAALVGLVQAMVLPPYDTALGEPRLNSNYSLSLWALLSLGIPAMVAFLSLFMALVFCIARRWVIWCWHCSKVSYMMLTLLEGELYDADTARRWVIWCWHCSKVSYMMLALLEGELYDAGTARRWVIWCWHC